jgi:hypothetical protein
MSRGNNPPNREAERRSSDWRIELIRAVRETLDRRRRTARLIALLLAVGLVVALITLGYQVIAGGAHVVHQISITVTEF